MSNFGNLLHVHETWIHILPQTAAVLCCSDLLWLRPVTASDFLSVLSSSGTAHISTICCLLSLPLCFSCRLSVVCSRINDIIWNNIHWKHVQVLYLETIHHHHHPIVLCLNLQSKTAKFMSLSFYWLLAESRACWCVDTKILMTHFNADKCGWFCIPPDPEKNINKSLNQTAVFQVWAVIITTDSVIMLLCIDTWLAPWSKTM